MVLHGRRRGGVVKVLRHGCRSVRRSQVRLRMNGARVEVEALGPGCVGSGKATKGRLRVERERETKEVGGPHEWLLDWERE